MQENSQRMPCWTVVLISSLIVTFMLAFSYWFLLPRQVQLWSLISNNDTDDGGLISELSMPQNLIPKELKLKHKPPFIYQILH